MDSKPFCYKYPHPAVSSDCILFGVDNDTLRVLLIERKNEPYRSCWAFPGGFMEIDETSEQCAARELYEETGLSGITLYQLGAYSTVNRDPRERVMTVAFIAVVNHKSYKAIAGDDAVQAKWFSIFDLPKFAFDHNQILSDAVEHLRLNLLLSINGEKKFLHDYTLEEKHRIMVQLNDYNSLE